MHNTIRPLTAAAMALAFITLTIVRHERERPKG
jgi:hypothetical protein